MMHRIEKTFAGRRLIIETGRMAKQAAGSALVQFGETMVLAAVTVSDTQSPLAFFPLTVEYKEKTYAAGKIPGGFIKREGRPQRRGDPLGAHHRPLDPPALSRRLQERSPGLHLRDLGRPAERRRRAGPPRRVGRAQRVEDSVRAARSPASASAASQDKWVLNPTFQQLEYTDIDLVVAGIGGLDRDGRGRRARGVPKTTCVEALRSRTAASAS